MPSVDNTFSKDNFDLAATPGSSQNPASNPLSGRFASRMPFAVLIYATNRSTMGDWAAFTFFGIFPSRPAARARQIFDRGQWPHVGDEGKHTMEERSISAWLKCEGLRELCSSCRTTNLISLRAAFALGSLRILAIREITRTTFPSIAGNGSPNAMLRIAPAVY